MHSLVQADISKHMNELIKKWETWGKKYQGEGFQINHADTPPSWRW